jgi:hypothetical protein
LIILNAKEIIERIKERTSLRTNKDICNIIGVLPTNFSRKIRANEFEAEWAFLIAQKYGLSTDWILTGSTAESKNKRTLRFTRFPVLNDIESWLDELQNESSSIDRNAWLKAEIFEKIESYKDWTKRREEQQNASDNSADKKIA